MSEQPPQEQIPDTPGLPVKEDNDKEGLEKRKLQAEIDNLTKPFYQKIEFWSFAATASVALITALILYTNGAFDIKTKNLEIQRNNLQFEINKFTQDTIGYASQRRILEHNNAVLSKRTKFLTEQLSNDSLRRVEIYKNTLGKVDSIMEPYRKEIMATNSKIDLYNKKLESTRKLIDSLRNTTQ